MGSKPVTKALEYEKTPVFKRKKQTKEDRELDKKIDALFDVPSVAEPKTEELMSSWVLLHELWRRHSHLVYALLFGLILGLVI